jgi:hypothetical protein
MNGYVPNILSVATASTRSTILYYYRRRRRILLRLVLEYVLESSLKPSKIS